MPWTDPVHTAITEAKLCFARQRDDELETLPATLRVFAGIGSSCRAALCCALHGPACDGRLRDEALPCRVIQPNSRMAAARSGLRERRCTPREDHDPSYRET